MADDPMNNTGLSDDQCKEVHKMFMRGVVLWVVVSAVAHMLTYSWMPWFPNGG